MQPGEWEDRLLYSLFIGKRRDEVEIPAAEFDLALKSLTDRIKTTLGAYTRVRFIEGETLTWGQEPTALVLVIAGVKGSRRYGCGGLRHQARGGSEPGCDLDHQTTPGFVRRPRDGVSFE